jgi:hypothetical protein
MTKQMYIKKNEKDYKKKSLETIIDKLTKHLKEDNLKRHDKIYFLEILAHYEERYYNLTKEYYKPKHL